MSLTWKTVDKWREEKGLSKAAFSRRAGIPENTIHRGVKANSELQPTTQRVLRDVFPEKFNDRGEVIAS